MLYFYTKCIVTDKSKLNRTDIWHLLPIVLSFVLGIPQLFTLWALKLQFATDYLQNNKMLVSEFNKSTNSSIPFMLMFLFRPVYVVTYLIASIVIFVNHLRFKKQLQVFQHQKFMYPWLTILFALMLILIVSHTAILYNLYITQNSASGYFINVIQTVSFMGLTGLIFSPFFFPEILYGMPRIPEPANLNITDEALLSDNKKQPSEFEQDYLLLIKHKVEVCMSELQPYLQPDCNLAYFAKLVKLPAHHLAYYFREERMQAFNDYRNEWRVNHAKKLISGGKTSELTLEAIGLISGFSSRNAFFTAFKKVEEISPSAYAAQFIK
jgi:AraC-like DNA-binding protein